MIVEKISDIESIKKNHLHLQTVYEGWIVGGQYRVLLAETGRYKHIRVRRLDNLPICDFNVLQNIKNYFWGEEVEGVSVFPKVSNYIDNSNTYHIFGRDGMEVPNLKEMYEYEHVEKKL